MTSAQTSGQLIGRQDETRRIDELTGAARAGRGGALVLRGEAGIGKSALLDGAVRAATGFGVVRACGSQYESELPFAALHQLCVPILPRLAELPARQGEILRNAFGLSTGAPDVLRIGAAALELLSCATRERPLLCLIDDCHWLDTASAKVLAFLARRVGCESVAMVFAARLPHTAGELDDLPGLFVGGLGDADARAFLAARSHVPLDEQVRQRIMAEARGNPLALLELPRAGGFAPPDASSVPSRIERSFRDRLSGLSDGARSLLTVASADPIGDPGLLWPAARRLGLDIRAAGADATATGLIEFSTRVSFCHPLARSAVYRAAAAEERRTAHRALAEVTDPVTDPDRRAWHRAQASTGPDDEVAAELERSATRAETRGGVAAAAAFLERAAELSLDGAARTERTLAAVRAKLDAGINGTAAELLTTVANAALDEYQRARVDLLRGQIAFVSHNDGHGPVFMLRAAQRLAGLDPEWSRECFLDALEMSLVVGRATGVMDMVLAAARSASPAPRSPDVLDALIRLESDGHRAGVPLLRSALDGDDTPLWTRRPALAVLLASELWDPLTHAAITEWLMKTGRESGSPLLLRLGLAQTTSCAVLSGDLGQAMEAVAEEEAIADAIDAPPVTYHRLQLAAMRGRREEALELFETVTAAAGERGAGQLIANTHWAAALLHNGLAEYPAALAAARRATAHGDLFLAGISLPELVEAAVRCGEPDAAATALESLTERTAASGTSSGLGIAAYARGLVTGVEDHYREAIEYLEESPMVPYRARAHLLYGEWLRREGRRRDCRPHLRTAHELLSGAGVEAFARRAADELRATGEKAQGRSGAAYDRLTAQEVYIARLVTTGATSKEVAARLFLSPRTIDAHLRNIFRKLGISSRRQLRDHPGLGG
ncbi:AAA family ATPase [Streptomyces corynorhini]|uniref:Helix-turn-helix transcriptional regulator n=1 Tax=Streptomyces corynorhini TaxID=2282652 RepID=A0A370BHB3_9ACTN|nr:LuxR family transcriptional regulator [Streptomyces corynorhini]RDG38775.1 helix-turn-helix transcriptional regulator [Streptomyces corynorhini]